MSWLHITGNVVVDWAIKLSAFLAACAGIWRYALGKVFHYFQRLEKTIKSVESQLFTNGGSTLRDTVEQTATNVSNIAIVVNDLNDRVEFLERIRERQDLIDEITAENDRKLKSQRPYLPPREAS